MATSSILDLTGRRFGRLVVITLSHTKNNAYWHVQCDCGNKKTVRGSHLTSGKIKSCRCLDRELARKRSKHLASNYIHGHACTGSEKKSPEYCVWTHMIQRCYNPHDRGYKNYGARGITVCARWRRSFKAFFADMGSRPKGKTKNGRALYSIERINNNRGYSKSNCKWATIHEQARNRRKRS